MGFWFFAGLGSCKKNPRKARKPRTALYTGVFITLSLRGGERMEQEQQRWAPCKSPASKVISSHTKSLQPPFGVKWSFFLHSLGFFFSGCGRADGSKGKNEPYIFFCQG